ncbi:ABC transporter ATP-binding protein [Halovenus marina]|uniref:ABC transporter ATP-binding protein n=1 Tax=Halovenus marina TaxID=3396621 RepID=UPI003F552777
MTVLSVNNVSKTYNANTANSVEAIRDIDFELDEGEFLSVIGPTGCGKSTLMKMVAGLVEPTEGEIGFNGEPITGPREEIGVVFQEESTFPWRNTLRNVEFGLQMRGVDKEERRERAQEIIELVGLGGFESNYPAELSGGMRQRVAIGRTLALNPDLMLMDEPFGALDEQTRIILGEELLRICRETNQTTLFITHSLTEAAYLSDRVLVMSARPGQIKEMVDIEIERPRDHNVVTTDEFNEINDHLWHILRDEAKQGFEQTAKVE